jgi:(Z)-2-((N-methylformamido)methylene)-5-hydroxybutyrolactone dehydrogenase
LSTVGCRKALFVGGEFVPASGESFVLVNPSTGEPCAEIGTATNAEIDEAVESARRSFDHGEWGTFTGYGRGLLMLRLADLIDEHAHELGSLETAENGKLLRETISQAHFAARIYRYFAGLADKIDGRVRELDSSDLVDLVIREPYGVCLLLIAWNSPMQLLANKLAPALAAGNVTIVKPSEYASTSVLEFARITQLAGFPPGVINVVTGRGREIGQRLCSHPGVDLISLTGGISTGEAVVQASARDFKKLVLELGGKSPQLVFADADLERAIPGIIAGIFAAAGQTCIAGSRLLVAGEVYEEVVERLATRAREVRIGDPMDPETEMGPLANAVQFELVLGYIESARAEGARLVAGGSAASVSGREGGFFVSPTIFADVTSAMRLAQEEVFGPVLCVMRFTSDDEAVHMANDSVFGLAAGIWTENLQRALAVARRLQAGTVWINTYRTSAAGAPFGGYKRSGIGRERGMEGLWEYTQIKNVMIDVGKGRRDPFALRV